MVYYPFSWLVQNLGILDLKQAYSNLIQKVLCHFVQLFLWRTGGYEDLQHDILPLPLCSELTNCLLPSLEQCEGHLPSLAEFALSSCYVTT